ncbi:MAG: ATP-binding protein [Myxococcota bacterium]
MPRDLQNVLDAVLDGLVLLDRDGQVELLNAEACRILASSPETLSGAPLAETLGPEHALIRLARSVGESRRPAIEDDVPFARRLKEDLRVDVAVAPLDAGDPQQSGVIVTLRDRTIFNSLREMVSQREQLTAFGQFAAGIAHEVKNPLGGIRGAAELLASWAKEERAESTAQLIVREVDRIVELVDGLMVFAEGDTLRLQSINLHQVLDGVLDLIKLDTLAAGIAIERAYDPSIPEFLADPDRLTQVFLNLTRNALQALEGKGGRVTLGTRMTLEGRVAHGNDPPLPTVVVSVSDNGPGIPETIIDQLATPFFTTRPEGTGLGLALSRHWITRHGGTLRIASELGSGTEVLVGLPLRTER